MDVSAFMTGYFIGLAAGVAAFVLWTYTFGRILPERWPFARRKIANFFRRLAGWPEVEYAFSSRRRMGLKAVDTVLARNTAEAARKY